MKKIAVLIHSLTVEYSINALNGVCHFFKNKDIQLIICPLQTAHSREGFYEYQSWSGIEYLYENEIDGVIVITGSFSTNDSTELFNSLRKFKNIPVFSIGVPVDEENFYYTQIECTQAYDTVIKHLKEVHGCSKIGFFSANITGSTEAMDRFNAYKKGLKANGLKFNKKLVLEGAFTASSTIKAIESTYKTKEDIPFDAILCANDIMASACQQTLQKLGVKIPEDVKIIGFDDTSHASLAKPRLSTIDQGIFEQGYEGGRLLYAVLNGEKIPRKNTINANPVFRQSCGCIKAAVREEISYDKDMKLFYKADTAKGTFTQNDHYYNYLSQINNISAIFDMVTASQTLQHFNFFLKYIAQTANIPAAAVCLFEKPVHVERDDNFILPDKVNLTMLIDNINNIQKFNTDVTFDPHKKLFPEEYFSSIPGNYILQPVFSGSSNYGYFLCNVSNYEFSVYSIILKIIINAISQSYEYTKTLEANEKLTEQNQTLQQNNSSLSIQSKTDELTKILNRRGFWELGQKTIDISLEENTTGMLFFMDMDGLKTVNDTYGHKTGDAALKALASIFTLAFRSNDIVARISGDEFAAIAVGMAPSGCTKVRERIEMLCKEFEKENKFKFRLSCSIGYVEFTKKNRTLKELLQMADKLLYEEKNIKHKKNKIKKTGEK